MKHQLILFLALIFSFSCSHQTNYQSAKGYREISSEKITKEDKVIINKYVNEIKTRLTDVADQDYEAELMKIMKEFNNSDESKYVSQAIGQFIYKEKVYARKIPKDPALNGALKALLSGDSTAKKTALYMARDLSDARGIQIKSFNDTVMMADMLIDYDDQDLITKLMKESDEYFPFKSFMVQDAIEQKHAIFLEALESWTEKNPEKAKSLLQDMSHAHDESSPLWNKEQLLPDYLSKYLENPKESDLSKKYFKKTGKTYVEDLDETIDPLELMSFRDRDLLQDPKKLTPKILKSMIDDKISRLEDAIDGKSFMSTPKNINGTIDGLGIFLEHALNKTKFTIGEKEPLIEILQGPKGEKILKAIRNPQILDQLEEFITRFYLPVIPDASEKVLVKIRKYRDLKKDVVSSNKPATSLVSKEVKTIKGKAASDNCQTAALSIINN